MNRAQFLTGFASILAAPWIMGRSARAETAMILGFGDLIPGGGAPAQPIILKRHKENAPPMPLPYDNREASPIRTDLDGVFASITGYMVPLAFTPGSNGTRISQFLLAPFIGACIHVPPPPSNQLVLGDFPDGIEVSLRIWVDPVVAIGRMSAKTMEIDLAKVGYQMAVESIAFFEG